MRHLIALTVIALVLSACGTPAASPAASAPPATPSPTEAAAATPTTSTQPTAAPTSPAPAATPTSPVATATAARAAETPVATKAATSAPSDATARPAASASPAAQAAAWTTYHGDSARRGHDPASFDPASVRQLWQSDSLDGELYGEPLVVGGRVYVATEGDTVYALDAASGAVAWKTHLGTPVPGSQLPCGDVDPVGVTSTPVADPAQGLLYVAAFEAPGKHVLAALKMDTGAIAWQRGVDPPGDDPHVLNQRGALALANGNVYVPFGGRDGDCGDYHGWVVSAPATGGGQLATYRVPATGGGGRSAGGAGIWAPGGEALDGSGNLFVATGNGGSSAFDYSDSVVKLSPSLQVLDYFAPSNWQQLSISDADLGSLAPVLLDSDLVFVIGKEGVGFLLKAGALGKIGGQAYAARVCSGAAFSGAAYAAPYVYVPCTNGIAALKLNGSSFQAAWRGPAVRPGAPIVAGGAVWSVERTGRLTALDAASGQTRFQTAIPQSVTSFPSLSAVGNRLYVPAGPRVLAFGAG